MSSPSSEPAGHYFSPQPDAASAPTTIELVLPEGRVVVLGTDRGVFSPDRVDAGTRVLLAEALIPAGAMLVDVGAGYGPVAITMALRAPDAEVWAVEVNDRARDLCRANAERNGVGDRVRVVAPDEVPAGLVADTIWSNPPIRIGKAALHALLTGWLDRLSDGGRAELVVHKHLGGDSLARWLGTEGWAVDRRASRAGYRVLSVGRRLAASERPSEPSSVPDPGGAA